MRLPSAVSYLLVGLSMIALSAGCLRGDRKPFASSHTGASEELRVVRDQRGRINHIAGRFGAQLPPGQVLDFELAKERAVSFIDAHRSELGLGKDYRTSEAISFRELATVTKYAVALRGAQVVDGVPLDGGELVVVFNSSGEIINVNGTPMDLRSFADDPKFGPGDALLVLEREAQISSPSAPKVVQALVGEHFAAQVKSIESGALDTVSITKYIDGLTKAARWAIEGNTRRWVVDPVSSAVIATQETTDPELVTRNTRVAQLTGTIVVAGTPIDRWLADADTLPTRLAATGVERVDLAAAQCRYELSNGPFSNLDDWRISPHVLDVDDAAGHRPTGPFCTNAEYNAQSCPNNFTCDPTWGDGSRFRQQHFYRWGLRAMSLYHRAVLSTVGGASETSHVHLNVDTIQGYCSDGAAGCFRAGGPDIRLMGTNNNTFTLWHELGHYLVWVYGDFNNNCFVGDESDPMDEAVADALAGLVAKRRAAEVTTSYSNSGRAGFGVPHLTGGGLQYTAPSQQPGFPPVFCIGNPRDAFRAFGMPFYEAVWEASFGLDCSKRTGTPSQCTGAETGINGDIGWANNTQAAEGLMHAIGYAISVTGPAVTMPTIASLMITDLTMRYGDRLASEVGQVFRHHNVLP